MTPIYRSAILIPAALLLATPGSAAVLDAYTRAGVQLNSIYGYDVSNSDGTALTVDTNAGGVATGGQIAASASLGPFYYENNVDWAEGGDASAYMNFTLNAATGAFTASTSQAESVSGSGGDVAPTARAEPLSYLDGYFGIHESFRVSGSGTLKVHLDLTNSVDLARSYRGWSNDGANVNLQIWSGGNLLLDRYPGAPYGPCTSTSGDGSCETLTSSLHSQHSYSTLIAGITELTLSELIFINDYAQGTTSFRSLLAYETTGDLKLTPSDSRFLSDPAFVPSPVPLPAGLPLSVTALLALGWSRKLRKQ